MEKNFETTILMSTYNNVEYIEECLDSIENQTYFKDNTAKFQVLVGVDGCPKTYEKIVEIKDRYRNLDVFMLSKNVGSYVCLNTLLPLIKYDNIIKFDSDDIMLPNCVEVLSKKTSGFDVVQFKFKVFWDEKPEKIQDVPHPAAGVLFYTKKSIEVFGGYHENRFSSDYELLVRTKRFLKSKIIDDRLFLYRRHSTTLGNTVNKSKRIGFDNMVRSTNYTKDNVKIEPIVGIIKDSFTTFKENVV